MLFNSIQFLIFFPLVTAFYFAVPHRFRWMLLLAASCYFYMAFVPVYILILGFTIVVDYFAGIAIASAQGRKRRVFLICSLTANIGVLAVFKYLNFLNANVEKLAAFLHWNYPIKSLAILLPIGLSFHTFQAMSYTIEVYRGAQSPERNFGIYALYVMFYPQLVAGPIERPQNLLPQFREEHYFDYDRITSGMRLMAWGFFKKIVIADRLAVAVNMVYNEPTKHTGVPLIIATCFFAYQIYCDFSGYTDIARGSAQVMGFRLMENFNRPYSAKSIPDFWVRWHISLSSWFNDYLFIPLARWHASRRRAAAGQGSTRSFKGFAHRWVRYLDIYLVFLISGIWHGANWTFFMWGLLHGTYLVVGLATKAWRTRSAQVIGLARMPAVHNWVKMLIVFSLVTFAWIFFRANTLSDSFYIARHLFVGLDLHDALGANLATKLATPRTELLLSVLLIIVLEIVQFARSRATWIGGLRARPLWLRWAVYYSLIAAIFFLGEYQSQQFIYFQF